MNNLELQKQDLLKEIEKLGYSSLRYSIFSEEKPGEWEVVIEYNQVENLYFVYGTLDWNSLVGKTFEDRAFVSTSVESKTAFGGGVRWEINAPKGSKEGMVTASSMFPNENELLLPRNSKFLIKGIDKVDNKIILKMDLIE